MTKLKNSNWEKLKTPIVTELEKSNIDIIKKKIIKKKIMSNSKTQIGKN